MDDRAGPRGDAAHPERYSAMVAVGASAGLRQGELFGLGVDDIDFDGGVIRVARQVKLVSNRLLFAPPKYRRPEDLPRLVPMSDGLGENTQEPHD
jgi:integrase